MSLISGTVGDDTLNGTAGNDTIDGGDGTDFLWGQGGADTLIGGAGNENLDSDARVVLRDGGEGDGLIAANDPAATVFGGTGDDTIQAGSFGSGPATMAVYGGSGRDVFYSSGWDITQINLSSIEVLATGNSSTTATAAQIQAFIEIVAFGDPGGNDSLVGGGGGDLFLVGTSAGTDSCGGGIGNDRIEPSADNLVLTVAAGGVTGVEAISSGGFAGLFSRARWRPRRSTSRVWRSWGLRGSMAVMVTTQSPVRQGPI